MSLPLNPNQARTRLLEIAAKRKAELEARQAAKAVEQPQNFHRPELLPAFSLLLKWLHAMTADGQLDAVDKKAAAATPMVWNEQQLAAIELAEKHEPFCLIGAAGTGKTTTVKEIVRRLIESLKLKTGKDSIGPDVLLLCSFTNRAVRNIQKAVVDVGASYYTDTIHKFLGFHPEYFTYMDDFGNSKNSMQFVPKYTRDNPKEETVLVVVDESSMVDTRLFAQLRDATPNATFIFIGDLNQLPPVFGDAILGFKLNELPVVELTQVYRQALESPIIRFQHEYTLKGKVCSDTMLQKITDGEWGSGLRFVPFKKHHQDGEVLAEAVAHYMTRKLEEGVYDPEQDTILIPFNKAFGSILINLHIAEYLAKKNKLEVHEIFSGRNTHYFAVGDFVMYDKRECYIRDIKTNAKYFGKPTQPGSVDLSRYGYIRAGGTAPVIDLGDPHADSLIHRDFQELLDATDANSEDADESKRAASHVLELEDMDSGTTYTLSTTGDVNKVDYGYCMTIHKSQGSEWRKVWLVLCNHHKTMLSRELIYTGMTRARQELEVIYSPQTQPGRGNSSISAALKKSRIPGVGWQDKAKYFCGKVQQEG